VERRQIVTTDPAEDEVLFGRETNAAVTERAANRPSTRIWPDVRSPRTVVTVTTANPGCFCCRTFDRDQRVSSAA
jgi:hypothetical protein